MKTKTSTLTSKSGVKIKLTTCDTFTLAMGQQRIESTPKMLAQYFPKKSLQSLRRRTTDQSEQSKLDRAIALAK